MVYVAAPIFSGAQVLGVVRVTLPTSILNSRVQDQLQGVFTAGFATILLAVLVAFVAVVAVLAFPNKLPVKPEEAETTDAVILLNCGLPVVPNCVTVMVCATPLTVFVT